MKYVTIREKINSVMTMDATSYAKSLKNLKKGNLVQLLNRTEEYILANNLTDKRIDTTSAANVFLSSVLNNPNETIKNDAVLKSMALRIVFADEDFYQDISDMSDETIAIAFGTDIDTVACKKILDKKLIAEKNKVLTK